MGLRGSNRRKKGNFVMRSFIIHDSDLNHSGNEIVEVNTGGDVARKERRQMCTDFWLKSLQRKRPLGRHKCIWKDNIKISLFLRTKMGK